MQNMSSISQWIGSRKHFPTRLQPSHQKKSETGSNKRTKIFSKYHLPNLVINSRLPRTYQQIHSSGNQIKWTKVIILQCLYPQYSYPILIFFYTLHNLSHHQFTIITIPFPNYLYNSKNYLSSTLLDKTSSPYPNFEKLIKILFKPIRHILTQKNSQNMIIHC